MDYELMYPSRFIKAADFRDQPHTFTIISVVLEKLEGKNGEKKVKGIVGLKGQTKNMEWLLNRTNGEALKLMFGRETNDWIGKRVTLYPKLVESFGEEVLAVRVLGSPDIGEALSATVPRGNKSIKVSVQNTAPKPSAAAKNGKGNGKSKPETAHADGFEERPPFGETGVE